MSKTLIGICAYGGLPFLELGLRALEDQKGFDVFVIVAKPEDYEMAAQLNRLEVSYTQHDKNLGFAAAINDMYDHAFVHGNYDSLIICGNDVVPMPGGVEAMIKCADETDNEMVCGSEFNARFLYNNYPEARKFFHGDNLIFTDFSAKPWLLHQDGQTGIEPDTRKDIRNFTLFKRSAFQKVGYADVSFWPNGYFEDNDYGRRCDLLKVKACGLKEAAFFHFWSRTIHQNESRDHGKFFDRNRQHYIAKWGGEPGTEKALPELKIGSRDHEATVINHWSNL